MKKVRVYRCECGEDVYEGQGDCVACGRPEDPEQLQEVEIADIVSEEIDEEPHT